MTQYLIIASCIFGCFLGFVFILMLVGVGYVGTFRMHIDNGEPNKMRCDFDVPIKTFEDIVNKKWIILNVEVVDDSRD